MSPTAARTQVTERQLGRSPSVWRMSNAQALIFIAAVVIAVALLAR